MPVLFLRVLIRSRGILLDRVPDFGNLNDLGAFVKIHHLDTRSDPADITHGSVGVGRYDPLAVVELLLMQKHLIAENAGVDGAADRGCKHHTEAQHCRLGPCLRRAGIRAQDLAQRARIHRRATYA